MKPLFKHHISDQEMEQEFKIIEEVKKNVDAFQPLYNKYYNEIKKSVENTLYVNYSIKNEELVKDITASVFEVALLKIEQYKVINGIPFKSWLYRIMQNQITEYIRKTIIREKHEKFVEQYIPKYDEISTIYTNSPYEDIKLSYLKKYIPKLAANDKMLLQYRFINEYSYKEISKIMGLSENSLRTRMTRLLRKIQNYIENKGAQ